MSTRVQQGLQTTISTYISLLKPGIIMGNLLNALAGYALVFRGGNLLSALALVIGLSAVIGSACICNNYIDREIDAKMVRTRRRAFVTGEASPAIAFAVSAILLTVGVLLLFTFCGGVAALFAGAGFVSYVWVYSLAKHKTEYATLLGSISGALPPLVGYAAAGGMMNVTSFFLFLVFVLWQMPHFYAIALYRKGEYQNAMVPVLPVVRGNAAAKKHILGYTVGFAVALALLLSNLQTTVVIQAPLLLSAGFWIALAIAGFFAKNDGVWARKNFIYSLIVVTLFFVLSPFIAASAA